MHVQLPEVLDIYSLNPQFRGLSPSIELFLRKLYTYFLCFFKKIVFSLHLSFDTKKSACLLKYGIIFARIVISFVNVVIESSMSFECSAANHVFSVNIVILNTVFSDY